MLIHTKKTFSAAHKLESDMLNKEECDKSFGKCQRLHGHNWTVEVDIMGIPDAGTGLLLNFNIIKEEIDYLDHKYLNELEEFSGVPITAENIATHLVIQIAHVGRSLNPNITMIRVKVWENKNSYAEEELHFNYD